jgi:hypothetical protein
LQELTARSAAQEQRLRELAAQRSTAEQQEAARRVAEEQRQREAEERRLQDLTARSAAQEQRLRELAAQRAAEERRQREAEERRLQDLTVRSAAQEQRLRELATQQSTAEQQASTLRAAEEERQREMAAQRLLDTRPAGGMIERSQRHSDNLCYFVRLKNNSITIQTLNASAIRARSADGVVEGVELFPILRPYLDLNGIIEPGERAAGWICFRSSSAGWQPSRLEIGGPMGPPIFRINVNEEIK